MGSTGSKSGIKRAGGDLIRGVSTEQIEGLRGTRDHQTGQDFHDIRNDYAKAGIKISDDDAKEIAEAIEDYTHNSFGDMRKALQKERSGRPLTTYEENLLREFKLCEEYSKVAPIYTKTPVIHRGVGGSYAQQLRSLKPGDKFDLEMTSSFSSKLSKSQGFAGYKGVILHVQSKDARGASVTGLSHFGDLEGEVLVSKRNWRVTSVKNKADGNTHIYLTPDKQ